jgi:L,D-transpeptidase ErfK/SrfK
MGCGRFLCGLVLAFICASPVRATELVPARALSGSESQYVVGEDDSFASIGSRFGVEASVLAQVNGLNPKARLQPGSTVWVDNRHIVPDGIKDGILINIPQRMLFFFNRGVLTAAYPVGRGPAHVADSAGRFHSGRNAGGSDLDRAEVYSARDGAAG